MINPAMRKHRKNVRLAICDTRSAVYVFIIETVNQTHAASTNNNHFRLFEGCNGKHTSIVALKKGPRGLLGPDQPERL